VFGFLFRCPMPSPPTKPNRVQRLLAAGYSCGEIRNLTGFSPERIEDLAARPLAKPKVVPKQLTQAEIQAAAKSLRERREVSRA